MSTDIRATKQAIADNLAATQAAQTAANTAQAAVIQLNLRLLLLKIHLIPIARAFNRHWIRSQLMRVQWSANLVQLQSPPPNSH